MSENANTYHGFLITISACIILSNSYALSLFMRYKNLVSKANFMLLSLALSEFMTGAVNIPAIVHAERRNAKHMMEPMTFLITADMTTVMCAAVTMMTLCGIIVDRYLVICFPMKYMSMVTKRKIILFVVASWILPLLVSFLRLAWLAPLLSLQPADMMNATRLAAKHDAAITSEKYYYIIVSLAYLVIVATLAILFILMFRAIRRLGKDEREFTTEKRDKERLRRETKAVILFGVMFVAFILCWSPLVLLRFLASVFPLKYNRIPERAVHALIVVKYLTSIINPSLYILYKYEFYQEFQKDWRKAKKLCCCLKKRGPAGDVLTEVSFISHNQHNGRTKTYWAHSDEDKRQLASADV